MMLECRDDRERAIVATLWYSGLRHGELRDLELGDIDLSREEITVTGKGGFRASVPILSPLKPFLIRWLEQRPNTEHSFVFVTRTGQPLYPKAVWRLVKRLAGEGRARAQAVLSACVQAW